MPFAYPFLVGLKKKMFYHTTGSSKLLKVRGNVIALLAKDFQSGYRGLG